MTLTQIFALVVLSFAADALKWENCDGSSPVKIRSIQISPVPIPLRKGASLTISGGFSVRGDAGTKYRVHLKLQKKVWFWVTLPCLGFCTHEIECDQLIGLLEGEKCPLEPKEYIVKQRSITLPDIKIPSVIKSGRYRITADLINKANNQRVACVKAEVEIKS